jgi:hypothetical protein
VERPPDDPDAWTYATVLALVERRTGEPAWCDFKAVLNEGDRAGRSDHAAAIRRTACAMANTEGGFLVFGVLDAQAGAERRPVERIVGLPPSNEFGKQLGDKLDAITPPLAFQVRGAPIALPDDQMRGIVPVRVPASPLGHAVVEQSGALVFYRRGDGGKASPMGYYEVRDRMLYSADQQRKLRMLRLELREFIAQTKRIHPEDRDHYMQTHAFPVVVPPFVWQTPERFDAQTVKALLVDTMDILPVGIPEQIHWLATVALRANRILDAGGGEVTEATTLSTMLTGGIEHGANSIEERLKQYFGPLPGTA